MCKKEQHLTMQVLAQPLRRKRGGCLAGRRYIEGSKNLERLNRPSGPQVYLAHPRKSIPLRLAPLASESWAFSSTSSSSSPSPSSSSSNGKLWWRRGDNSDMVELLQLSGGDGEHNTTASSPCPPASAMRAEKEPEAGRDLALQSAGYRVSEWDEAVPHRPAAHIWPAKFKPAERRRGRGLPAAPARAEPGQSRRAQAPRCHGDAWGRRGLCPSQRRVASSARASVGCPFRPRAGSSG